MILKEIFTVFMLWRIIGHMKEYRIEVIEDLKQNWNDARLWFLMFYHWWKFLLAILENCIHIMFECTKICNPQHSGSIKWWCAATHFCQMALKNLKTWKIYPGSYLSLERCYKAWGGNHTFHTHTKLYLSYFTSG